MKPEELRLMIAADESLNVEFKSDRGPLPDAKLLEVCVYLANHQGGQILIGVEKEGRVTRRSVKQTLNIGEKQAEYLLKTWVDHGKLTLEGKGRSAHYTLNLRK